MFLLHDAKTAPIRVPLHDTDRLQGWTGTSHDPERIEVSSHDPQLIYGDAFGTLQPGKSCIKLRSMLRRWSNI